MSLLIHSGWILDQLHGYFERYQMMQSKCSGYPRQYRRSRILIAGKNSDRNLKLTALLKINGHRLWKFAKSLFFLVIFLLFASPFSFFLSALS